MPFDVAAIKPGDTLADKFRVVRRLGEGGMGAVFEVEHAITRHRRALKLLHSHVSRNPMVVQRFLREASAAGRIGNPHIAETFDAGQLATGEFYLVMEFLRGKTLGDYFAERGGPATNEEIADLMGQVCDAVAAAHAAGIVHRDLKPDNLFVVSAEGRPFVKVLDFGISKFDQDLTAATPLTREGQMLGTPYYMSPEQFKGQSDVDGRSDIYSLGVILYELASGQRPYDGESLPALVMAIAMASPVPLHKLRPDMPLAFCRLTERAMDADRERRHPSATELARELRAALGADREPRVGPSGIEPVRGQSTSPPAPSDAELPMAKTLAAPAHPVPARTAPEREATSWRAPVGVLVLGIFGLAGWFVSSVPLGRRHTTQAAGAPEAPAPEVPTSASASAPLAASAPIAVSAPVLSNAVASSSSVVSVRSAAASRSSVAASPPTRGPGPPQGAAGKGGIVAKEDFRDAY
jgi:serine/threonine protein kinase